MSEPELERFEVRLRLNATISVQDAQGEYTDWLKPGTEAAATWRGIPSQEELMLRYEDMSNVTSALLEEVVVAVRQRLTEARRER